jgi:hypothetical protein
MTAGRVRWVNTVIAVGFALSATGSVLSSLDIGELWGLLIAVIGTALCVGVGVWDNAHD